MTEQCILYIVSVFTFHGPFADFSCPRGQELLPLPKSAGKRVVTIERYRRTSKKRDIVNELLLPRALTKVSSRNVGERTCADVGGREERPTVTMSVAIPKVV